VVEAISIRRGVSLFFFFFFTNTHSSNIIFTFTYRDIKSSSHVILTRCTEQTVSNRFGAETSTSTRYWRIQIHNSLVWQLGLSVVIVCTVNKANLTYYLAYKRLNIYERMAGATRAIFRNWLTRFCYLFICMTLRRAH
jgi:hypothetical protein